MPKLDYKKADAYLRDSFIPFSEANLSIASSPVLYGLSIYTVFSVNWNAQQKQLYFFRLKDHYQRLVNSASIIGFNSFAKEWPYEKFHETMVELIKKNDIREDVLVRATVFIDEVLAGTRIHGLKNSLSAFVYPIGELLPRKGARLCVSSYIRTADSSIPSRAKVNGSYVNASLMKSEALLNGYDDAISIDEHGHVAESTVANLFIVRGDKLVTPSTATDILEGITRDTIIKLAHDMGIELEERSIDRSELYIADEAFLCGSSARITPVLSIDRQSLGAGKIGAITQKLLDKYLDIQHSKAPNYHDWLLPL